jgi:hypothetical protein
MKLLTTGIGPSFVENYKKLKNIKDDIQILAYHRCLWFLKQEGIKVNYWTFNDPDGALLSLKWLMENLDDPNRPKIIVPHFLKNLNENTKYGGTSAMLRVGRTFEGKDTNDPLYSVRNNWEFYHTSIKTLDERGEIEWIESTSTRYIGNDPKNEIFTSPAKRFEDNKPMIIGSVNFDGITSASNWAKENKFTSSVLPVAHYLKAKEVYNLGFDSKGRGFRTDLYMGGNEKNTNISLEKFKLWVDWEPYHKMKIYSVAEDKYTPNNTVLKYKPLETLLNG